jgi:hypothetical protein
LREALAAGCCSYLSDATQVSHKITVGLCLRIPVRYGPLRYKVEEELRQNLSALRPEEAAVITLLRNRLNLTLNDKLEASLKSD